MSPAQAAFDTHAEVRKLKQAGCPEAQAQVMVDLVARAPANPQLAEDLEGLKSLVQGIEHRLGAIEHRVGVIETTMATRADLEILRNQTFARIESLRAKTIEMNMSTQVQIETLRGDTKADIETLRGDMGRMIWLQRGTLAAFVLAIATMMLT